MRGVLALLALTLLACSPSSADPPPITDQWRSLDIRVEAVTFPEPQAGRLRFRGGLHLIGPSHDAFGGLSGLEVLDDGRMIAISDDGEWFEARLVLNESGDLVGLAGARSALMRDERGEPFENKQSGDSEDVAQLPDGRIAVSFEQTQTIRIYDLNRDGPFGAARRGPRLDHVRRLPHNAGLEAMTATAEGALLVGAEGEGHRSTPLWLAPLDAQAPVPTRSRYPLDGGYSLTSLDRLPNGDFVALERFYAPVIGARARITTFPAASLDPGGVVAHVEELAVLAPPMPVDNFEGVSAVRMPNGATRLYIVSDDNFSDRQRTLLLAFDIIN
ncbi:MAG: esterase-like activity of phytase family protein [Hyphomonadaceae bacterium]|nr:esterase-like activity of phytase family protein [Hyphomonadaceae bacterium]